MSLADRLWQAVLTLLAAAVAAYLAWHILRPLIPVLIVGVVVMAVIKVAVGGGLSRRRW